MKKIFRFVAWSFKGFGLFEAYMFSMCFFMAAGGAAGWLGDPKLRNIFFMLALAIVATAAIVLMYKGITNAWKRFTEDEEKVFDILKEKNIREG